MQVVVDSLLTHYEKSGKGKKVILLLHGWGDTLSTFDTLEKSLSLTYVVLRLDLPGFGTSQIPQSVWGLEDYAQFLKSFLQKINIKSVYAVIGHSNGGAVAITALGEKNIVTEKLILLASAGIRNKQQMQKSFYKLAAKTGKVATFWLPQHQKKKLRTKLYGSIGSDLLIVPELEGTFKKTVSQDVQSEASTLQLPTLIIYGADDTATPVSYGQILHSCIDNSELHIIPSAGHFVHHDQVDTVNELIGDFLG